MFIKLTLSHNQHDYYVANLNHIVDMHRQKDDRTCITLVNGNEIYVAETPLEIMRLIGASHGGRTEVR